MVEFALQHCERAKAMTIAAEMSSMSKQSCSPPADANGQGGAKKYHAREFMTV